jgi:hypothetical protein
LRKNFQKSTARQFFTLQTPATGRIIMIFITFFNEKSYKNLQVQQAVSAQAKPEPVST